MYHSRFFFFRLASALKPILKGARLLECYSQQKDELMLVFLVSGGSEFSIKADLSQGVSLISFPEEPGRSRANSVNLFPELLSQLVEDVEPVPGDRLFKLCFQNGLWLSFKMYGQRSNILLHDSEKVLSVFNNHLRKDLEKIPETPVPDAEEFLWHPNQEELKKRCPGFNKRIWRVWEQLSASSNEAEKPLLFSTFVQTLQGNAPLFLCREENEAFVSFFPSGEILLESADLIEVSNRFYRLFWQINRFEQEKKQVLKELSQQELQVLERIQLLEHQVLGTMEDAAFRLQADLLMAYGHALPRGLEKISLPAFDGSGEVEIRLKKDLSIPDNAERLYRKSRGKQADLERVQKNLSAWKDKAQELRSVLQAVDDCKDLKSLRKLIPSKEKPSSLQEDSDLPFHLIHFMQYEIRIGKNAKGNDELLRISHKDDHWLHARDVAGSHVLVRKRKGQNTPSLVLERAAELAAYYSRGRNESLCPVMLTERKYVRKIKGSAAGLVKVEREKTLLVSPKA